MIMPGELSGFDNEVRTISASETIDLRLAILRPNKSRSDCIFPGDEHESTRHFGAYIDGALEGIVSLYHRSHPDFGDNGYQIRAMATSEKARGKKLGIALLRAAEAYAFSLDATYIWANARVSAQGFYQKAGYILKGDEFLIEGIGPHIVIYRAKP